jgi:uncharacterized membrane protein
MNTVLWIVTALLALAFAGAGLMKLTQPKPKLVASGQAWAEDFSDGAVRAIGALEVLGALGLVLPALLDTATGGGATGRGGPGAADGRCGDHSCPPR